MEFADLNTTPGGVELAQKDHYIKVRHPFGVAIYNSTIFHPRVSPAVIERFDPVGVLKYWTHIQKKR
jgi:hypothetical protein